MANKIPETNAILERGFCDVLCLESQLGFRLQLATMPNRNYVY